jgi:hypothetical protein
MREQEGERASSKSHVAVSYLIHQINTLHDLPEMLSITFPLFSQ